MVLTYPKACLVITLRLNSKTTGRPDYSSQEAVLKFLRVLGWRGLGELL